MTKNDGWWDPKLTDTAYRFGDIYDEEKVLEKCRATPCWRLPQENGEHPYYDHVKQLTPAWPHLEVLSDFMETTVTAKRWGDLYDLEFPHTRPIKHDEKKGHGVTLKLKPGAAEKQQLRAKKVNVCRLDYYAEGTPTSARCDEIDELPAFLATDTKTEGTEPRPKLRLFVVEDLSRDVIEQFGSTFDVDPSFFRAHLVDYAWCNTRDPWRDPPSLYVASQQQSWVQLRFVTPRYYSTGKGFKDGQKEAESFNVFRRPDNDRNMSQWDSESTVGIMRTRASIWLQPRNVNEVASDRTDIGILLLDPTITEGLPLWRHYRNWKSPPPMPKRDATPPSPREQDGRSPPSSNGTHVKEERPPPGVEYGEDREQDSFFEDFIHWATTPSAFASWASPSNVSSRLPSSPSRWANVDLPLQALLHRICCEWLTMADYVKTRLNHIELEVSTPEHFLPDGDRIDVALKKLHTWRRSVPVYREMLEETLEAVFGLSPRLSTLLGGCSLDAPSHKTMDPRASMVSIGASPASGGIPGEVTGVGAYRYDYALALAHMEEHQRRIDRLASIVTAAINIEDTRRGYAANKNVNRLTLLATLFVPLSLVASLFSMQPSVQQLKDTVVLWAEIAIPSALIVWFIAKVLISAWMRRRRQKLGGWLRNGWAGKGELLPLKKKV